ncbi:MAG TPA: excinuclease ABC subunit UvrB [Candidatus Pacearchaeota archaeon]|nr:excinuclease ABC subunit UvrB [Candidatus Pacearchaeota archaeon]HRR94762.1 excinuclease ABC subunit UvrB [Candidatus Paceibacterota bacterium]HPC30541.1 excinuclease ABC subunit UvrB [Candidatus Pacearchaeota archaeon]HQG09212.1 excinuclease ABC subunit UvrB [Candidatus Pacearchaeota archaeon]HQH20137.1 excinuclease ABC subunit UvrB [Candidatus Pacearchaeota archaeon]
MQFRLKSKLEPKGDQPKAIKQLVEGWQKGYAKQTLLGVTGSGKTFTIANAIAYIQRPTLVISHNKTLAAQLCNEFREFFPDNAVEYFVSYYDYYQPETYIAATDTYIEKEAQINEEIDRLRHACTQALMSRPDVIIVASVSCIYGLGSPEEYEQTVYHLEEGQKISRLELARKLIELQFERTNADLFLGLFRLHGQVLELMPVNEKVIYRFSISEKIDSIEKIDPITKKRIGAVKEIFLFPAKHYLINENRKQEAIKSIREELKERLQFFEKENKPLERERLERRVNYDLEMIENIGYCQGIENYSRHFDGRKSGEPPFTLLDYFKKASEEFLVVIDESHVTIPQIGGMYAGDFSRKKALIENGFRLPSAYDNRPLRYDEFEERAKRVIYVSATPGQKELKESAQIVEQIVRPTGLVDPEVVICPITGGGGKKSQIEDLIQRIKERIKQNERTLVTTLTKRMAEDLADYLEKEKIKVKYLHSDIKTLDRVEIITDLRKGNIDVVVGVNLLREGLDMPEVSLVAILDADKEGFLRNETSLIQTIGRAARNINGQVILYADKITDSIKKAVEETERRRQIQLDYNQKNGITPKTIEKEIKNILEQFGLENRSLYDKKHCQKILEIDLTGDARPLEEIIKDKKQKMKEAAESLEFELAAILRDEIKELERLNSKQKSKN